MWRWQCLSGVCCILDIVRVRRFGVFVWFASNWIPQKIHLRPSDDCGQSASMFSHVVIFWTDPAQPNAADELIAGANQYLKPIPGVLQFHVGKMVGSHRPVVDQTYQVALNLIFPSKQAQDDYQVHPLHVEFVEKVFKRVCKKVLVYDFE